MMVENGSSRQEQKAATREALKAAAIGCFAEKGYVQTKIGDVTGRAGVAQGTFYVHFASKEELLDELLREFNDGMIRHLAPIWFSHAEPGLGGTRAELVHRIHQTADSFLSYWQDHQGFVEIYAERMAAGLTVETLRDGINPEAVGLVTTHLRALLEERGVDVTAIKDSAVLLVVQGLLALWARIGLQFLFNEAVDRAVALDTLERMTEGALDCVLPGLCVGSVTGDEGV